MKNNILQGGKKPIVYDCFFTETSKPKPIVIFCHGYKGFKDWGAWNLVAQEFANAGLFFVKFNFSHNGGSVNQPIDFPDLEAFAENNYSLELEDLERIINHISQDNKFLKEIDTKNISLIGHSRGGGIVLLKAEEDERISKLITWAGVCDYKSRFKEGSEGFERWRETGTFFVENGRTKQKMPHNWQFYVNFLENENKLTIKRAAKGVSKPWLIIHGDKDTSVLLKEGKTLHKWSQNSILNIIKNANHVFGANHPWGESNIPQHLKEVVAKTIQFIMKK
jgi:pimeloyl-ACP methyl ester carboxylesterase